MNCLKSMAALVSFAAVCASAAGGAASIVAKASGKGYSEPTRTEFLKSCMEGVEKPTCECVLKKLEGKYDEATFKRLEGELNQGKEDPNYVNFIVESTTSCMGASFSTAAVVSGTVASGAASGSGTAAGSGVTGSGIAGGGIAGFSISPEEMEILKAMLQSKMFKNSFAEECADEVDDWFGKKQAKKSCECAYDNLMKNDSLVHLLTGATNAKGEADDFERWGYEIIAPCLPKQFTPEMEKAFIRECTDEAKANKATCQCVLQEIKKDYTVESMMKAVFTSEDKFELDIAVKAAKCLQ